MDKVVFIVFLALFSVSNAQHKDININEYLHEKVIKDRFFYDDMRMQQEKMQKHAERLRKEQIKDSDCIEIIK